MPEADTIERVKSRKVQVASLPPADSGRGFARLSDVLMAELGLNEGDVIEIVGKRSTAARAIRPYGEDEGIDIVRLDGLQRANAGVGSGDFVEIKKGESNPATRVVFAPAQPNARLQGSADALKRTFAGRPLVEGDTVATAGHQRINADMPDHIRQLLNAPPLRFRSSASSSSRLSPRALCTSTARRRSSCFPNTRQERRARRRHL
jgi:transitional endoplasmic reticulum ATPase